MYKMSTESRKQREIREREHRILRVARAMLLQRGYLGLGMDAIASELEYSKGTIYNHFPCKEEIIIALAIEAMGKRCEMFERAAIQPGQARKRMAGIGVAAELFVRLYPDHFGVEQLIRSASIWEKTSENRRDIMRESETRCMSIVAGLVRDGIAQGDLTLTEGISPEDLVFGLWSQSFGAYSIIATTDAMQRHGIKDAYRTVLVNLNMMLDGYGWRPFSTEFDYIDLFARLKTEVFPDEVAQTET